MPDDASKILPNMHWFEPSPRLPIVVDIKMLFKLSNLKSAFYEAPEFYFRNSTLDVKN